ncbi:hypothetical protein FVO59_11620 [Microbacterium esteraromaticum]|uniref:DUF2029 domain-containing protein n=1 Tax=Microbacterium esteraromaticum TaxID=57043 RepID=A0A7D8AHG8_9MICO|nr:hypothetical protein [Microbacterium esteraromaticum]QMU97783.1 hypothetical protein FVO59_11620 [Microbacterium esteraromaticum]
MRSRSWPLWAAFLGAHLLVAVSGWLLPSQPMGDVVLVYQPWSAAALGGGTIVGVTENWVYPQLALLPMLLAQPLALPFVPLLGTAGAYLVGWAVLVTVCDALGLAVLLRDAGRPRRLAAWFWIAALLLLGPIAMYRIDAITLPVALAGGLWLATHPRLGASMLAVGAWIKIWPGALLVAAVAAGRHRMELLITAASATAVIVVALLGLGAGDRLLGFLTAQTGRGLQIEAVAATPFLWAATRGEARIEYSLDILTYQVIAPAATAIAAAMTPLMVLAFGGILALGVVRARAGARWQRLLPPLALALITALIVTNKVGSPQFTVWLIAPAMLWIVFDRARAHAPAALVLLLCALTFSVYPLTYAGLLAADALPVLLLTVRNGMLVVLLVVALRAVLRTPTPAR